MDTEQAGAIALAIVEQLQQCLLVIETADLRILQVNAATQQALGLSRKELIGRPITEFEMAIQDLFFWDEVRAGNLSELHATQGLYRRADGSLLSVEKSIQVLTVGPERLLLLSFQDASPRQRADEALEHSSSLLAATLEATAEGILVTRLDGGLSKLNRHFAQLWHIPETLLASGVDAHILAYLDAQLARPKSALEQGNLAHEEHQQVELVLRDGRVFERHRVPLFINGQLQGQVYSFRDITLHRRRETELERAMLQAREASRAKSAFLAVMSHEIRTPMNGILGMLQLTLDSSMNDEQRRNLEMARFSAEALLSILDDILDFSKIESGQMSLTEEPCDIAKLCLEALRLLAPRAEEKGLELLLRVDARVPGTVLGAPGRLRQIVLNLVSNAIKFTEQGGVYLDLTCETPEQGPGCLHMHLRDTGIGIAKEAQRDIFAAFTQADSSIFQRYGGTGLGLSIVQRLIQLMHGEIWLESQPGAGSTFHIRLPLHPSDNAPQARPDSELAQRLLGQHVLIASPSAALRDLLCGYLGEWGLQPVATGELGELEALSNRSRFQYLVLDHSLGEPLFDLVERTPLKQAGRVLILLPAGKPHEGEQTLPAMQCAYLNKPVDRAGLLLALGDQAKTATADSQATPVQIKQGLHVLLVEDNEINALIARRLLEREGLEVEWVSDGAQALERLASECYDLALVDMQMPILDGLETTRRIRLAEHGQRQLPIIAMTANALDSDREACRQAGMDGFVAKPFKTQQLFDEIARVLQEYLG